MIRDDAERALLFDMDMALVRLNSMHRASVAGFVDRLLSQPAEDVAEV